MLFQRANVNLQSEATAHPSGFESVLPALPFLRALDSDNDNDNEDDDNEGEGEERAQGSSKASTTSSLGRRRRRFSRPRRLHLSAIHSSSLSGIIECSSY